MSGFLCSLPCSLESAADTSFLRCQHFPGMTRMILIGGLISPRPHTYTLGPKDDREACPPRPDKKRLPGTGMCWRTGKIDKRGPNAEKGVPGRGPGTPTSGSTSLQLLGCFRAHLSTLKYLPGFSLFLSRGLAYGVSPASPSVQDMEFGPWVQVLGVLLKKPALVPAH